MGTLTPVVLLLLFFADRSGAPGPAVLRRRPPHAWHADGKPTLPLCMAVVGAALSRRLAVVGWPFEISACLGRLLRSCFVGNEPAPAVPNCLFEWPLTWACVVACSLPLYPLGYLAMRDLGSVRSGLQPWQALCFAIERRLIKTFSAYPVTVQGRTSISLVKAPML